MEKLNESLALLTNRGVLAGLAVLVYEVNQNTKALQNETDVAVYSIAADNRQMLLENSELRRLYTRVETERWDQLTPDEQMILDAYWSNEIDRTELQFILYKRNATILDNIIFNERDLALEAFKKAWSKSKELYDPDFVAFFEGLIEDANHDQ